jgi:hypothetical protein
MTPAARRKDEAGTRAKVLKRDPEAFWQKVNAHFFQHEHGELDYSDFLEYGEACGMLAQEVFSTDVHGGSIIGDPEEGDMIYVPVPKPKPKESR